MESLFLSNYKKLIDDPENYKLIVSGYKTNQLQNFTFSNDTFGIILQTISRLECRNFRLQNFPHLNAEMIQIIFDNMYMRQIELYYFKNLTKLQLLKVSGNDINTIKDRTFTDLEQLEMLILNKNNITNIESDAFIGLYKLIRLELTNNAIVNLHVDTFKIMDCSGTNLTGNLIYISVRKNEIKVIKSSLFVLRGMTTLNLAYNQITMIENNSLPNNIDSLYLEGNHLSSIDKRVFYEINIKKLTIFENEIECNCNLNWIENHSKMKVHLNNGENQYMKCYKDTQLLKTYIEHVICITIKGIYIYL